MSSPMEELLSLARAQDSCGCVEQYGARQELRPDIKSFMVNSKQPGTGCRQLSSKQPLQLRPSGASVNFFRCTCLPVQGAFSLPWQTELQTDGLMLHFKGAQTRYKQAICLQKCLYDLRTLQPREMDVTMQGWKQHGWGCRQSGRWTKEQHHAR